MNVEQLEERIVRFCETGEQQGQNFIMEREKDAVMCYQQNNGARVYRPIYCGGKK